MDIGIEHLPSHRVPETIYAVFLVLVGVRPFYWQSNTGLDGANSNYLVIHTLTLTSPTADFPIPLTLSPRSYPTPPLYDHQIPPRQQLLGARPSSTTSIPHSTTRHHSNPPPSEAEPCNRENAILFNAP